MNLKFLSIFTSIAFSICAGTWIVAIHFIDKRIPMLEEKINSLQNDKDVLQERYDNLLKSTENNKSALPFYGKILERESEIIEALELLVTLHFVSTDYAEISLKDVDGNTISFKTKITLGDEKIFYLNNNAYSLILLSTQPREKITYLVNQKETAK